MVSASEAGSPNAISVSGDDSGKSRTLALNRDCKVGLRYLFGFEMKISIHSLLEGATRATGAMAFIDVFRAFYHCCCRLGKPFIEGRDPSHRRRKTNFRTRRPEYP